MHFWPIFNFGQNGECKNRYKIGVIFSVDKNAVKEKMLMMIFQVELKTEKSVKGGGKVINFPPSLMSLLKINFEGYELMRRRKI